jgi:DNA repair protein RadA/Sms
VIPRANAPKQPIEGMTIVAVDRLTEAIERVR